VATPTTPVTHTTATSTVIAAVSPSSTFPVADVDGGVAGGVLQVAAHHHRYRRPRVLLCGAT
jgi:hypothetical protein